MSGSQMSQGPKCPSHLKYYYYTISSDLGLDSFESCFSRYEDWGLKKCFVKVTKAAESIYEWSSRNDFT